MSAQRRCGKHGTWLKAGALLGACDLCVREAMLTAERDSWHLQADVHLDNFKTAMRSRDCARDERDTAIANLARAVQTANAWRIMAVGLGIALIIAIVGWTVAR